MGLTLFEVFVVGLLFAKLTGNEDEFVFFATSE
jgi:hypothetical protein